MNISLLSLLILLICFVSQSNSNPTPFNKINKRNIEDDEYDECDECGEYGEYDEYEEFQRQEDQIAISPSFIYGESLEGDCKNISSLVRGSEISNCKVNEEGKIISLKATVFYQTTIDDLSKLTELQKLEIFQGVSEIPYIGKYQITSYEPFRNLKKVTYFINYNTEPSNIYTYFGFFNDGIADKFPSLKKLKINNIELDDYNVDAISKLTNLEALYIKRSYIPSIDSINKLNNLTNLSELAIHGGHGCTEDCNEIDGSKNKYFDEFPNLYSLKKLKKLTLNKIYLTTLPEELSKLTNLEYLDLRDNAINDDLPQSLNNLKNLQYIYLGGNENIKGKVLTNESLIECEYSNKYSLCKPKDMTCFKSYSTETAPFNFSKRSQRCGAEYGSCPAGQCCSKNGYCGTTAAYCSASRGCQLAYGDCKCGTKFGNCSPGSCCSKSGYCGTTAAHCSTSRGCQLAYGDCKCGTEFGNCSSGSCCSKKGYCGKTVNYCSEEHGCQLTYGDCRCGTEFGNCSPGSCCSKKGYCGTTKAYCYSSNGCQPYYGKCRCGETFGDCDWHYCCSKKGYCGMEDAYCNLTKGCQIPYGFCKLEMPQDFMGECFLDKGKEYCELEGEED